MMCWRPFRTVATLIAGVLIMAEMPVMAQESGGVRLAPGLNGGPAGLARPLPFTRTPLVSARDLQGGPTPADRKAQNQNAIARLRGDPGYLAGFAGGIPLAPSRQPSQTLAGEGGFQADGRRGERPIIINNEGPLALTVGNGNVIQQQSAIGSGPIAQQQVATTSNAEVSGGGATNLITTGGNIVQRTPSGR